MNTLLLLPDTWDLVLNSSGNIAMASEPYSIAQDVASACKLFLGELYYDNSKGIPYFENILGMSPADSFVIAQLEAAALTVPNVVKAKVTSLSNTDRVLTGTIEVIDTTGAASNIQF